MRNHGCFGDYMENLKDMHIHIERGPYTLQWIEEFIFAAEKMNMREITLLEHSVRFKEFHPVFKEARDYNNYQQRWFDEKAKTARSVDEFRRLACEVKSGEYPVKINFGIEVCWFEQHEKELAGLVADDVFDIVIGSVHWVDNWVFNQRKYQWLGRDIDAIYRRYFEMENTLMQSGIFDVIAHPDLIMCHSLYPSYDLRETYEIFCKTAKKSGVAVEMNTTRGTKTGLNDDFLKAALREGVRFSTGSDAHCPEDVGKGIKEATELICRK